MNQLRDTQKRAFIHSFMHACMHNPPAEQAYPSGVVDVGCCGEERGTAGLSTPLLSPSYTFPVLRLHLPTGVKSAPESWGCQLGRRKANARTHTNQAQEHQHQNDGGHGGLITLHTYAPTLGTALLSMVCRHQMPRPLLTVAFCGGEEGGNERSGI